MPHQKYLSRHSTTILEQTITKIVLCPDSMDANIVSTHIVNKKSSKLYSLVVVILKILQEFLLFSYSHTHAVEKRLQRYRIIQGNHTNTLDIQSQ